MESLLEKTQNSPRQCETICETSLNSFRQFYFTEFSLAIKRIEGKFLPSLHLNEWAIILQVYPFTSIVSARKHIKTGIAQAYIAWKLKRMEKIYDELELMGYLEDLAGYHLKKLKRYINALPEIFGDYKDLTNAESILHYEKDGKEFICTPSGILSFKRGRHPRILMLDDILRDPEKRLDISQLEKIERIFLEEVMSMPTEELHLFGTPQDRNDLFAKIETMPEFFSRRYPGVENYDDKKVLWPENFPFERLIQIKNNIGNKAFDKEYMCRPVRATEGFLQEETLDGIIKSRMKNYNLIRSLKLNEYAYGGLDIGKKTHPSHLAIFGVSKKRNLIQIHSKWMDGWDYKDQIGYCKEAIKKFNMARLYYDDTRAEFEGFKETGELPTEMEGLCFTAKEKFELAGNLDKFITQKKIKLLNDERQKRQLLNVDNDLQAVETEEGHGDAFWSICLAVRAASEAVPNITILNFNKARTEDEDFGWRTAN